MVPAAVVQVTAAADQLAQRMLATWRQEAKDRQISTPARQLRHTSGCRLTVR